MQVQNGENFNLELFAEKLRKRRKEDGATLKEFAEKIGVALPTYQHYEGAKRKPPVEFVILLSKATGMSADYWLGLSENSAEKNSPNGTTIIQTAKAIIDCAEEMKDSLGEKISKLKRELHKA